MPLPPLPEFHDDEPIESLKASVDYVIAVLQYLAPMELFMGLLGVAVFPFIIAWMFIGLDSAISWASDSVPLALAVIGIIFTIKKLRDKHEFVIIVVVLMFGICGMVVLHVSRVRADAKVDAVRPQ
jgi:hypothetical protein